MAVIDNFWVFGLLDGKKVKFIEVASCEELDFFEFVFMYRNVMLMLETVDFVFGGDFFEFGKGL